MKTSDLHVSGNRVLIKEWQGDYYNWKCLAEFHHSKGILFSPETMAEMFYNLLKRQCHD